MWEATVMSDLKMMELGKDISRAEADHAIAKAQAEISFKAGYKDGLKQGYADNRDERKAGIREVVEWIPQLIEKIKAQMDSDDWGVEHSVIYPDRLDRLVKRLLRAKKKEWGIKGVK